MFGSIVMIVGGLAAFAHAETGKLGDAKQTVDNPPGSVYVASFSPAPKSQVSGSVVVITGDNGVGVNYAVHLEGLPSGEPHVLKIHEGQVPESGDCSKLQGLLDPYQRGEATACDPKRPETCQVGDVSGKFGVVEGTKWSASFYDGYASLKPSSAAYLGNRSLVIESADGKSRVACANFINISEGLPEECVNVLDDILYSQSNGATTKGSLSLPSTTSANAKSSGAAQATKAGANKPHPPQFTGAANAHNMSPWVGALGALAVLNQL